MIADTPSFEGLATQRELRAFYDSTRDRIKLEGLERGGPNMHVLDDGPRGLHLVHGDGTEFEVNLCNDPHGKALPLEVVEEPEDGSSMYYIVTLEPVSNVMNGTVSPGNAEGVFPVTSTQLATLQRQMNSSLIDQGAAKDQQLLEWLASLFEQFANPHEQARMLALHDELVSVGLGESQCQRRSGVEIMQDITELEREVLERARSQRDDN